MGIHSWFVVVMLGSSLLQQPTRMPTPETSVTVPASVAKVQVVLGESNVLRLPASVTTVTVTNLSDVDKMSAHDLAEYAAGLQIADAGVARGVTDEAAVQFGKPELVGRSGSSGLLWRVPINARAPMGMSQIRLAAVTIGSSVATTFSVEYTLTTRSPAEAQWSLRGSADVWSMSWSDPAEGRVYGFVVENQGDRLFNVRLALSTLRDGSGHALGLNRMSLVDPLASSRAVDSVDVPPNTARPLLVQLEPVGGRVFGTFDGQIRFVADGNAALRDLPIKIQATAFERKVGGIVLTLFGLMLTGLITALLRPQMTRLQARRAAAALRRSLEDFSREVRQTLPSGVPSDQLLTAAESLWRSVSDEQLDDDVLLPPRFSLPGSDPATEIGPNLKERLESVSKKVEGLFVLLRSGTPRLIALQRRAPDVAGPLFEELGRAAEVITNRQEALDKVKAILGNIPATARETDIPVLARNSDVQDLDLRIEAASLAAWSIWLVIALVLGTAWIASDPDYGTTTDLVSSFLWGFGVTAFGAGIQSLTPTSIATQINLKIPKG